MPHGHNLIIINGIKYLWYESIIVIRNSGKTDIARKHDILSEQTFSSGFDPYRQLRETAPAPPGHINILINMTRFSPQMAQRTQSIEALYDVCLRRHIEIDLCSSAFICGLK